MITCHIFSDSFPENLSGTGLSQPRGFKWFAVCRTSHADVVSVFIIYPKLFHVGTKNEHLD